MKKLLKYTVLVIVILSVFVCSGLAENIDISSLSDDDLLGLKERVDDEITIRGLNDLSVLPSGIYVVGEDIKSGHYHLIGMDRQTMVHVFSAEAYEVFVQNGSWEKPEAKPDVNFYIDPGDDGFVGLDNGQVLRVIYPCYIEEANEPWIP